ncbi:ABC transporter permease [Ideonella sp. 4Y11]|uniref:ABC transporter permease n=1 Tax=Ideonella aquatica TaxID=2824119 RepID=A0A940YHD2_9BURK|nr:ABC transporter permease [Ideonella aquatica]MBQ0960258.1 ABC transporter permease [Ideonella aquatica]
MRGLLALAARSAWHRRFALSLVVLSVALSALLLLAVERLRHDVRENFASAVSGTDLIVGARTGGVQLMLYAVFRLGQPTNTIRWSSVQALAQDKAVAWTVPLSLGDAHRGFPVVGTTADYFTHFRWGARQPLVLAQGRRFEGVFDAVIGAEVAERLGYGLGQPLVLRHGGGELDSNDHADKPFTVVGILARTGTPVDRSVHIGLAGMEAIHLDWAAGVPLPGLAVPADQVNQHDLSPKTVTAVLVGLKSRAAVFGLQRRVAEFEAEPLMAVLPGVALDELWDAVGQAERALVLMSVLVGAVSLAGLVAVVVTALEQRRRELAVLRSVGAGPSRVFTLLALEGTVLGASGALLGALAWAIIRALAAPWVQTRWGITLSGGGPRPVEWLLLGSVVLAGTLAGLLPGWRAYRLSLADGLTPRGS